MCASVIWLKNRHESSDAATRKSEGLARWSAGAGRCSLPLAHAHRPQPALQVGDPRQAQAPRPGRDSLRSSLPGPGVGGPRCARTRSALRCFRPSFPLVDVTRLPACSERLSDCVVRGVPRCRPGGLLEACDPAGTSSPSEHARSCARPFSSERRQECAQLCALLIWLKNQIRDRSGSEGEVCLVRGSSGRRRVAPP